MRILLQRVLNASVQVDQQLISQIDSGLLLFVGFCHDDIDVDLSRVAAKIVNLRVFSDTNGKLQHSLVDLSKHVLVVPQFTLYGNTKRGRRPDFVESMAPSLAGQQFDHFVLELEKIALERISKGIFGADMQVSLINDGPFTLNLEF